MSLQEEIDNEIESGQFKDKIKDHCAWCNAFMPKDLERYLDMGNACKECSFRFSHVLNGVRGKKKFVDKRGRVHTRLMKVRDYTDEEVTTMIENRLKEVKTL
jgi:DNA-directed RNA polymerase subunit RPC12/RpoP